MARIIIVDSTQLKASWARFQELLAKDAAEQERLRQLQQGIPPQSPESRPAANPARLVGREKPPSASEEKKKP